MKSVLDWWDMLGLVNVQPVEIRNTTLYESYWTLCVYRSSIDRVGSVSVGTKWM